jgi:cytochrome c556
MNRVKILGFATAISVVAFSVSIAQMAPPTPEQQAENAVKTRQGLFEVQGFAFGPVGAMLRDAPFDAAIVLKEAARLQVTSAMITEVFQFDTRKFHVMTKARESIWMQQADFSKRAGELQTAAKELEAAGKKGDKTATLTAATAVGNACKSCHDDYRDK